MARTRTKQEVRDFLNGLVGQRVNAKSGIYSGQCVSLIKALLEFFDMPNPYAGRGNAISVNDTLLREGLATNGKGWLTIVVNRDMGRIFENGVWNNYGHIWIDLQGEANFEQNGAKALYTTKNTRPISQGQQFINLDNYIKEDDMPDIVNKDTSRIIRHGVLARNGLDGRAYALNGSDQPDGKEPWEGAPLTNQLIQDIFLSPEGRQWRDSGDSNSVNGINARLRSIPGLQSQVTDANTKVDNLTRVVEVKDKVIEAQDKKIYDLEAENAKLKAAADADQEAGDNFLRRLGQFLVKYIPGLK